MRHLFFFFFFILILEYDYSYGQKLDKPNVIIILSDDQGYGDFSINGNPVLETPGLDKLAKEGIRFADFHVSPLCTPSRGELLSGLDALHNQASTVGSGRNVMRRDIVTMPEIFKQNGYRTGIFGKWHLGDNYPDRPVDRGFEKSVWFHGWGLFSEYEYDNDYYKTRYVDGDKVVQSDKYCTDLWFDKAKEWMKQMADQKQPFFVYLPTNAPHGPFLSPEEDYDYYKDKVESNMVAKFFGMLRNLDKNVNDLDEWLDRNGLKENTIVIFLNDNGGTGGVELYNANMRGKKGDVFEGGHRAACFVRWPAGNISGGRVVATTSEVQDLLPTLVDILNLKVDKRYNHFDGVSLRPVVYNTGEIQDRMFVVQHSGGNFAMKYNSCVVWNDWRLVENDKLYNIKNDIGQTRNLYSDKPNILKKMLAFYDKWWDKFEQERADFIPSVVGSKEQPSVILTSDFWQHTDYVNTQWKIASGSGPVSGGLWSIDVKQDGVYKIELSRWPFHEDRALNIRGVSEAVGGYKLRQGRAIPIVYGCLSVNEAKPVVQKSEGSEAISVVMETRLSKTDTTLRAWFKDDKMNNVCGAYYLRISYLHR